MQEAEEIPQPPRRQPMRPLPHPKPRITPRLRNPQPRSRSERSCGQLHLWVGALTFSR
jgi:hypothetical protein